MRQLILIVGRLAIIMPELLQNIKFYLTTSFEDGAYREIVIGDINPDVYATDYIDVGRGLIYSMLFILDP